MSGGEAGADGRRRDRVPSHVTARVQESHLAVEHLLTMLIERDLHP